MRGFPQQPAGPPTGRTPWVTVSVRELTTEPMYIGEAARRSGATPRAIRLYESLGLLSVSRSGNYRVYSAEQVEFIQLIKEAQTLGLSLQELQNLRRQGNDLDWRQLNELLISKRQHLEQEVLRLQALGSRIERYQILIADCVARDLKRCTPSE